MRRYARLARRPHRVLSGLANVAACAPAVIALVNGIPFYPEPLSLGLVVILLAVSYGRPAVALAGAMAAAIPSLLYQSPLLLVPHLIALLLMGVVSYSPLLSLLTTYSYIMTFGYGSLGYPWLFAVPVVAAVVRRDGGGLAAGATALVMLLAHALVLGYHPLMPLGTAPLARTHAWRPRVPIERPEVALRGVRESLGSLLEVRIEALARNLYSAVAGSPRAYVICAGWLVGGFAAGRAAALRIRGLPRELEELVCAVAAGLAFGLVAWLAYALVGAGVGYPLHYSALGAAIGYLLVLVDRYLFGLDFAR